MVGSLTIQLFRQKISTTRKKGDRFKFNRQLRLSPGRAAQVPKVKKANALSH